MVGSESLRVLKLKTLCLLIRSEHCARIVLLSLTERRSQNQRSGPENHCRFEGNISTATVSSGLEVAIMRNVGQIGKHSGDVRGSAKGASPIFKQCNGGGSRRSVYPAIRHDRTSVAHTADGKLRFISYLMNINTLQLQQLKACRRRNMRSIEQMSDLYRYDDSGVSSST